MMYLFVFYSNYAVENPAWWSRSHAAVTFVFVVIVSVMAFINWTFRNSYRDRKKCACM